MNLTDTISKLAFSLGVNKLAAETLGYKVLGALGAGTQAEAAGGWMDPNHVDGYTFNPNDGQWYAGPPAPDYGKYDWTGPADSKKQEDLTERQYWRDLNNRIEHAHPENGEGGSYVGPSLLKIFNWLPELQQYVWDSIRSQRLLAADTFNAAQRWQPRRDPLTLDLDGDGLETLAPSSTRPILFDHDGDGTKSGTGWIKADDGFLVLDRNSNGVIDNGTELFGDATPLYAGGKAADGFAALVQEDSNHDGKVDQQDSHWNQLRVWRDLNQDGISQADELFTLDQLKIASMNTRLTTHSQVLENGNEIADLGTYVKADGTSGAMGDVSRIFNINPVKDAYQRFS